MLRDLHGLLPPKVVVIYITKGLGFPSGYGKILLPCKQTK